MADLRPDKNWGKNFLSPEVCPDKKRANFEKMPGVKIRMKIAVFGERLSNVRMKTVSRRPRDECTASVVNEPQSENYIFFSLTVSLSPNCRIHDAQAHRHIRRPTSI